MGKSVKLKDLMNNPAYKRVSGDEESLEREVFVAEINRPGFELAGFFKHSDFRRIMMKHLVSLSQRVMKHQKYLEILPVRETSQSLKQRWQQEEFLLT